MTLTVEERIWYARIEAQLGSIRRLMLKLADDLGDLSLVRTAAGRARAEALSDLLAGEFEAKLHAEQGYFDRLSRGVTEADKG